MACSMEDSSAEPAFMAALLDATVYVHAPLNDRPGNLRLISFPHPQTGAYLVPFFSDRRRAEEASSPRIRIIGITGRKLFEITAGATLILNPNQSYCLFYPEEIAVLLQGKVLPPVSKIDDEKERGRALEPEAQPPGWLIAPLPGLFETIPGVESAAVGRYARSDSDGTRHLVLIVVVSDADAERAARAATLVLKAGCERLQVGLDVLTLSPSLNHPYGQFPKAYRRTAHAEHSGLRRVH
ncbi:MAG: SseB family protein [Lysobacteraceae bacterium]|jgi:hypothetical protein